ncbi:hypothetical protein RRG08_060901 [Elysia crispata]|uniref:Uncharacterized protein n=1 Tax=Elysia crispata TaxID=231223 RepID=A0AAE1E694_9GAST|nr:hypothetical protein RRG08_060901 [Elysia crispata]
MVCLSLRGGGSGDKALKERRNGLFVTEGGGSGRRSGDKAHRRCLGLPPEGGGSGDKVLKERNGLFVTEEEAQQGA